MMLGMFATYCGLIYNEFFALPMNVFESCYDLDDKQMWDPTQNEDGEIEGQWMFLRQSHECNVALGFDPVWNLSTAKLMF